jgi:hypothetical protein
MKLQMISSSVSLQNTNAYSKDKTGWMASSSLYHTQEGVFESKEGLAGG